MLQVSTEGAGEDQPSSIGAIGWMSVSAVGLFLQPPRASHWAATNHDQMKHKPIIEAWYNWQEDIWF